MDTNLAQRRLVGPRWAGMAPSIRHRALRCLIVTAVALSLASCASLRRDAPSAQLRQLMADSDEAVLARNPVYALYRGDQRFAAQHGDYLSDAYIEAERRAVADDLQRLASIDRAALPEPDRLAYDTFKWSRTTALRGLAPEFVLLRFGLPIAQFGGWHLDFAQLSSGDGVAPYRTLADYEHGLARFDGFVAWLDLAQQRLRQAADGGVVLPRFVVERMLPQFNALIDAGVERSMYYGPIRKLPADWPPAQRERIAHDYAAAIRGKLVPAFVRIRDFLQDEYLPRARSTVGLSQLPGGDARYAALVRLHTTTELTPQQIHRIGLDEVSRITASMETIRSEVGFNGTLRQFFEHLRTDARFKPASSQALGDGYRAIGQRVDAAIPKLFSRRPKSALDIRPTPSPADATDATARYDPGTPDGSRPGVFYYNTHDLPSRTTFNMETLYLHEAVPGHHFQGSLAHENAALPELLRFDGNTAYWEGWALYAESLGPELGMYGDAYQRFGHDDDEIIRALRLVIDTGLHTMGWTREQAIEYMLAHSSTSVVDATAEVERYIVNPGQALAYKIGQLTISKLRSRAQSALGGRFDIRDFHDQVLMTGALPMEVLEAKIDAWVARGGGR
jgi:uncharacterized protein (DUF885 family)